VKPSDLVPALASLYKERGTIRIFLLSALILYVEMLLIRWIGTEIRVFAYLQNGVLVAAFLGMGLGLRHSRARSSLWPSGLALTFVALIIKDPLGWGLADAVSQGLTAFQDSVVWANRWRVPSVDLVPARTALVGFSFGVTLLVLGAVAVSLRPLGQLLGRSIDSEGRPIAAYTANILGSLAGIVLFTAGAAASISPFGWLAVAGVGLAVTSALETQEARLPRAAAVLLFLGLPFWAVPPEAETVVWSPYQKLVLQAAPTRQVGARAVSCGAEIVVNGTFYQGIVDLDPSHHSGAPDLYRPADIRRSHYVFPYEVIGSPDRVLVVGAGTGNDVAAALRAGARSVQAVEIDPEIVRLGRAHHPNRPYASERVRVTVDDARAFFRRDHGEYDVVWFGLLDSHTTPSAYTNVRLDHFVYTRESFADVRRLLAPRGVVVLYFWAEAPWIGDRLARLLSETFGAPPLSFLVRPTESCLGHGGLLLIGGPQEALDRVQGRMTADPTLAESQLSPSPWVYKATITTDDWPYLYLERPSVPTYYLLVGMASLLLAGVLGRRLHRPGEPVEMSMLLLGAGFMLLEVSGVSRAALLFGTTWTVNAYVIGAILAMTLLANLVASLRPIVSEGWPFAGLVASLLALALIPTAWLAALPPWPRVLLGGAFVAVPVFFSGLIFVTEWSRLPRQDLALGSNILGGLLGGIASMLSLFLGLRGLTLLTLAVYLAARLAFGKGRSPGLPAG